MWEDSKTWTILLIDDDEDDYMIAREMLADAKGAKVRLTWANSYNDGRKILLERKIFDAVLVDYDLGAHTGLELIREATRADYPAPLILLTGRGSYEVDVEAMQAGASVYLSKNEVNALLLERSIRYAMERKRSEEALRASEDRYRRLVSVMPAGMYTCDAEGSITFYNQQAADIWGMAPEPGDDSIRYIGAWKLYALDGNTRIEREETSIVKVIENGQAVRDLEEIIERPDGSRVVIMSNIDPLLDGRGKVIGAINVFVDVTERQQAEEARRESEERFRLLADAMPQLVWTATPDGVVDYYNIRYHEYAGIDPTSEKTWVWAPVLHEEDAQATVDAWNQALRDGTVYEVQHRVRMANGGYRWHLSRGVPARDASGKIIKWYGTATDIHDQKPAEDSEA